MRFVMAGAGGVGGYFGGRLAAAGEEVAFIARGAHLAAMRENGLRVESPLGDITVNPVTAATDASGFGIADVVFIAVKMGDTADALTAAAAAIGPDTLVVSLQNGLEADDIVIKAIGKDQAVGGVAYIASAVEAPGLVRHIGANQRIQMGELAGGASPRVDAVVARLTAAGIDAEAMPDITRAMWQKFIFLVGLAATTTLTGETIGIIRSDPDMRAFLYAAMAEAAALARARGIDFPDDYADNRLAFADTLPDAMRSSMAHDFEAGKPLEVYWLSGAVARMGAEAGVATPVNATVYAALKPHAGGRRAG